MSSESSEQSKFIRFFSRPAVGIAGSVASIVGVGIAITFFLLGQKSRDLTAYVHPVRAAVVRIGQTSRLTVSVEDSDIKTDVTAVQLALWNRGGVSIRRGDILKRVHVSVPNCEVLEATVRKQSRDVINMVLDRSDMTNGTLGVSWDILEEDDGGVIQLIYAGSENTPIKVDGVIEGQPSVSRVRYSRKLRKPEDQYRRNRRISLVMGWFQVCYAILFSGFFLRRRLRRERKFALPRTINIMYCVMTLIMLGGGIYFLLQSRQIGPPFGF